jgi:hypothetical protein
VFVTLHSENVVELIEEFNSAVLATEIAPPLSVEEEREKKKEAVTVTQLAVTR